MGIIKADKYLLNFVLVVLVLFSFNSCSFNAISAASDVNFNEYRNIEIKDVNYNCSASVKFDGSTLYFKLDSGVLKDKIFVTIKDDECKIYFDEDFKLIKTSDLQNDFIPLIIYNAFKSFGGTITFYEKDDYKYICSLPKATLKFSLLSSGIISVEIC